MNLSIENAINHQFISSKLGENYHSIVYRIIFYILCFSTIKLLLLFKSPGFYKRLLDKIFNIKVTLFKNEVTIYFILQLWILILVMFLGGKILINLISS